MIESKVLDSKRRESSVLDLAEAPFVWIGDEGNAFGHQHLEGVGAGEGAVVFLVAYE
jgi:hypothetical protein